MKSLFLKGLEKKGPMYSSKTAVMLGMMSKKIGLPDKPREELHVRYDSDSKHNTALTLRKIKQESVIREPIKGETNISFNKNSL